jgi:hypothetical protein
MRSLRAPRLAFLQAVLFSLAASCSSGDGATSGDDAGLDDAADAAQGADAADAADTANAADVADAGDDGTSSETDGDSACASPKVPCGGACVSLDDDAHNCGVCGKVCATAEVCVAGACAIACPTGQVPCGGVCVTLASDLANCGACGTACPAGKVCSAGVCALSCQSGLSNCSGVCTNTAFDPSNCGACGTACPSGPHSIASCGAGGVCALACAAGWVDCNGIASDGCERNVASDATSCGGCGLACSSANVASPTCTAGACTGACTAGFADCDGDKRSDGCEISLLGDPSHCGGCGTSCSANNVSVRMCTAGTCSSACAAGFADCNGNKLTDGCETSTTSDPSNCGGCGNVCGGNHVAMPTCAGGTCGGTCSAGFADCNGSKLIDGCETSTASDPSNCGGCGAVCSGNHVAATSCSGGNCTGACVAGFSDCNNNMRTDGCEVSVATSPSNCGGCGVACSSNNLTASCSGGLCNGACNAGFADCNGNKQTDGCEVSVASDANNCGGCGVVCSNNNLSSRTCGGGVCSGVCSAGFADCNGNKQTDGCELNITTDPNNCGGCGAVCSSNHVTATTCSGGNCSGACAVGFADCDGNKRINGCETNLTNNATNCGGCGIVCPSGKSCVSSLCV